MAQQNSNSRVHFDRHPLKRKVKIYDVEKKELLFECKSLVEAEKISGVKGVNSYISQKSKCYKSKLGKVICFR